MALPIKLVIEPHILENAYLNGNERCRELTHEIRDILYRVSQQSAPLPKTPKAKLFLSYKNLEMDKKWVEDIEDFLSGEGHDVWYDKTRLQTGIEWESVLYREIENADFFIAFLSSASVDTKGWHHVEIRKALSEYRKFPESTSYIIPILLAENALPESLRPFHGLSIYSDTQLWLEKLGQDIMAEMGRRNSKDGSFEKEEFVYLCEDKEPGESKVCKRYKERLSGSDEFLDWYDKLKNTYSALSPVTGGLIDKHKAELRDYRCREEADEIFVDIAHRAPAILVSQGGESGICLNGHTLDVCSAMTYLRTKRNDQIFSVDDALKYLQEFKKQWCSCV